MRIKDDVVRDLVLQAEAAPAGQAVKLNSEELDEDSLNYYIQYLQEREVLDAQIVRSEGGKVVLVKVKGLTPTGHQLADQVRHSSTWNKYKAQAQEKGVGVISSILSDLGSGYMKKKFGLE